MALLLTASSGIREIAPVLESSVEKGQSTTRRWRGLYSELLAAAASIGGTSQRMEQEDDVWWVLHATFAGWPDSAENPTYPTPDSQVVTLWGLQTSRLAKSIWDFPAVKRQMDRLAQAGTDGNLEGIARFRSDLMALARGESYTVNASETAQHGKAANTQTVKLTLSGILEALGGIVDAAVIRRLFRSLARGVESYALDHYVLRKRAVCPNGANVAPAFADTNRAFRTATLLATETIPDLIRRNLPTGYWFKGAPLTEQTDANRYEVVQEWTFADEYDDFLYGDPL